MDVENLAQRLRRLRQQRWAEPLTQPVLGHLLGVKAPTISSWERFDSPAVPPAERLAAYATLFSSPRSLEAGRILDDAELTETETAERDELLYDLTELRRKALSGESGRDADPWHFPDGAPVRIICGKLADPPTTAGGHRWNYMALSAYADLDAMVELFGHIRACNPQSDVRVGLAGRLEGADLNAHLVLVGNLAQRQTDLRELVPRFPVRQVVDDEIGEGEIFEVVETGERHRPTYVGEGTHLRVIEDIGFLARTRSPLDGSRTLSICSGVHTRGVYGAVRTLTDREMHDTNALYLHERFAGDDTFGVLMRVRGSDHAIGTPRLSDPSARLLEFS